jgi:hypothetical protein
MEKRDAVAKAIYLATTGVRSDWGSESFVRRAYYLCLADVAINACESFEPLKAMEEAFADYPAPELDEDRPATEIEKQVGDWRERNGLR